MRSFALFFASALFCSAGASADPAQTATPQTQAAVPAAQPAAPDPDLDKVECRTMEAKTGSRLGARRECRTKREWDDIMARDQREIQKMQASGNLSPQGH